MGDSKEGREYGKMFGRRCLLMYAEM